MKIGSEPFRLRNAFHAGTLSPNLPELSPRICRNTLSQFAGTNSPNLPELIPRICRSRNFPRARVLEMSLVVVETFFVDFGKLKKQTWSMTGSAKDLIKEANVLQRKGLGKNLTPLQEAEYVSIKVFRSALKARINAMTSELKWFDEYKDLYEAVKILSSTLNLRFVPKEEVGTQKSKDELKNQLRLLKKLERKKTKENIDLAVKEHELTALENELAPSNETKALDYAQTFIGTFTAGDTVEVPSPSTQGVLNMLEEIEDVLDKTMSKDSDDELEEFLRDFSLSK